MSNSWKTPQLKKLSQAFLSLKNEVEVLNFLRDLCTLEELEEMSKRWEAVQMLEDGTPYRAIAEKTGLSTTTVTRISHWLNHGEGGYQIALKNTKKKSWFTRLFCLILSLSKDFIHMPGLTKFGFCITVLIH